MTEHIVNEKPCSCCGEVKPLSDFSKQKGTKSGHRSNCKACVRVWRQRPESKRAERESKRRWRRTPEGKAAVRGANRRFKQSPQFRAVRLRQRYSITPQDYDAMLAAQGGLCAICRQAPTKSVPLCVDHCHNSKKVRGLLCSRCNAGLGHFLDRPALLLKAANYLTGQPG